MRHPTLCLALWLVGCFGARDNALFTAGGGSGGGSLATGVGANSAADSGTGSGYAPSGARGGEAGHDALSKGGSGGATSGAAGTASGTAGTASGGAPRGNAEGGGEGEAPPAIESCDMLEGAQVYDATGHCYRVNFENLTFADARDACRAAGGHLATISDAAENDFVRDAHDGEHWLGATDGRADGAPGAGTYFWVDGEPWSFADWESDQPNAHETSCPGPDDASDCFEHCAFQTDEGDWNDRSCWHTVVSVCEWDVDGPRGAGGAGPGGAGP